MITEHLVNKCQVRSFPFSCDHLLTNKVAPFLLFVCYLADLLTLYFPPDSNDPGLVDVYDNQCHVWVLGV